MPGTDTKVTPDIDVPIIPKATMYQGDLRFPRKKVSLSDRFGIKLFYDSMDQAEYFALLEKMAKDENLRISSKDLRAEAVKWEMSHTGRNGRVARQLLDYLHGKA